MVLTIILYIITGGVSIFLLIGIIGLLLPKERKVTRQTRYEASAETVYNIVIDNEDFTYRTGIKEIHILKREGDKEEWEEIGYNGTVINFRTREKKPFSFYSFDMKNDVFTGYWTATFEEMTSGGTLFTATEHIRIKNPYLKVFSYPFFNIGMFMENYQTDLRARLKELPQRNS